MDKRLAAKRLLKRHNRHSASDLNWADSSKLNMKMPEPIAAARQRKRYDSGVSPKGAV